MKLMQIIPAFFLWVTFLPVAANGQTDIWRPMFSPGGGNVVAIQANHDSLVFCGVSTRGLYTSVDRGSTWRRTLIDPTKTSGYGGIAVGPDGTIFVNRDRTLYRSTDRGADWELLDSGVVTHHGRDLVFSRNGEIFGRSSSAVWKSTDNGTNWSSVFLLPDPADYLWQVLLAPNGEVFAVTVLAVYRSTDAGASWTLTPVPTGAMAIAPNNTITIASSEAILESLDGCRTWNPIADLQKDPNYPMLFYTSAGTLFYWSENDTGVVRSTDFGRTWARVVGLPIGTINTISESDSGWLYAGTESGAYRSTDHGDRWTPINRGLPPVQVTTLSSDAVGCMFAGTQGIGIFRSTDQGEGWISMANNYDLLYPYATYFAKRCGRMFAGDGTGIYRFSSDGSAYERVLSHSGVHSFLQSSSGILYAGGYDMLLQSTDCGTSWTVACEFNNTEDIQAMMENVHGDIFTGTGSGLFRSQDGGAHWTKQFSQAPGVTGIVSFASDSRGTLFAGTNGVLRSTDEGETWQYCLTGKDFVHIAVDPSDFLYAASLAGVYRSTDGGIQWGDFSKGLTNNGALTMAVTYDSASGYVYLVQLQDGIFRTYLPVQSYPAYVVPREQTVVGGFQIEQNYPNPFNPSTTIRYELPHAARVSLKVYNTLGQEVATLVDETKPAGVYAVQFDAGRLASGVYFYRIVAGPFTETKRLLLIR
jgi:photosystem II stability/assembly factor-like uncharacterized protein